MPVRRPYLEGPGDTAHYNGVFDHVRATALSALDSEALMADLADELACS
ncbi:hypothetical protein [Streptomyces sp. NPDC004728]